MSPRIFSQSKNRVFALNFRSSSETVSPLARSFSARWLPMNPFPPVIRILEISFSPIHSRCYRRDVETQCTTRPPHIYQIIAHLRANAGLGISHYRITELNAIAMFNERRSSLPRNAQL